MQEEERSKTAIKQSLLIATIESIKPLKQSQMNPESGYKIKVNIGNRQYAPLQYFPYTSINSLNQICYLQCKSSEKICFKLFENKSGLEGNNYENQEKDKFQAFAQFPLQKLIKFEGIRNYIEVDLAKQREFQRKNAQKYASMMLEILILTTNIGKLQIREIEGQFSKDYQYLLKKNLFLAIRSPESSFQSRTKIHSSSLERNPKWDQLLYIPLHNTRSPITFALYSSGVFGQSKISQSTFEAFKKGILEKGQIVEAYETRMEMNGIKAIRLKFKAQFYETREHNHQFVE